MPWWAWFLLGVVSAGVAFMVYFVILAFDMWHKS